MRRRLSGIPTRLIDRTCIGDDIGLAVDTIFPGADGRQFAGRPLDAPLSLRAGVATFASRTGRTGFATFTLGSNLASRATLAGHARRALLTALTLWTSLAGRTGRAGFTSLTLWTSLACGTNLAPLARQALFSTLAPIPLRTDRASFTPLSLRAAFTRRAVSHFGQPCLDLGAHLSLQLDNLCSQLGDCPLGVGLQLAALGLDDLALAAPFPALLGNDLA